MLDHVEIRVKDLAAARRFYEAVAVPLGLMIEPDGEAAFILGSATGSSLPYLRIAAGTPSFWTANHSVSASPIRIAFAAADREAVDLAHNVGVVHGGRDLRKPGWVGPKDVEIYAALLIDPDGNSVEAWYRPG